ncbi:methyltransferase FkbM family [Chloroherpeton thalassium ATCC 35110]|uniref:Methyltransferase FkbM family n=1 Tax=Chloroherpeton thalassium (strain ATCC 35110 / GB-78) TaxID=517418 RepID=B3QSK5_CHLT3|nr:FkbM family methyltransferase [Chloroherpeton thalassium]ACF14052.1 methyltransferase FkbM family [Chloroherpeton thalassium ATCC 35110]
MVNFFAKQIANSCTKQGIARNLLKFFSFKGKNRILSFVPPISEKLISENNGVKFHLNLRDDVQRGIFFNAYESEDIAEILTYVKKDSICVDIGANVGFYALHFANHIGDAGKVYAFEPDSELYAILNKNKDLNLFGTSLSTHQSAVGDTTGKVSFYKSKSDNSGWGNIRLKKDSTDQVIDVDIIKFDDFILKNNISRVDVLKIDVEGAEHLFMKGAENALQEGMIKILFSEFCFMSYEDFTYLANSILSYGFQPIGKKKNLFHSIMNKQTSPHSICTNFLFSLSKSSM